jgi:SSS family solute:Na+ symporter
MKMLIGYGILILFLALVVVVLEVSKRRERDFTDYAVAGRSMGASFQTWSFLNSWLPGTVFISFAGLAAGSGVIGFYLLPYSLLAVVLMFFMARRVFSWGKRFNLRTQADFVGMRYNSKPTRVVAAVIGIISSLPWIILGMQSLGLVFSYLSFGAVTPKEAVFIGIGLLALRQVWTVRMGTRGLVISDVVQSFAAYVMGTLIAVGLIVYLVTQGHGLSAVDPAFFSFPGAGSTLGPLYFMSIVLTGAFGAWCWPEMFVRLFTARSVRTIQRSAIQAAPIVFVFVGAVMTLAMLASSLGSVKSAPDNVWFEVASAGGVVVLALAAVAVVGATMGNVNANAQAVGAQAAQDIVHVNGASDKRIIQTAKISIAAVTIVCAAGAFATADVTSGLVTLALASYQGIVQLAPSLLLGIFWRRGTASGAVGGMIAGFATAVTLQILYPVSIPWLWGLTSGFVGLIINVIVYLAFSLASRTTQREQERVDEMFDDLRPRAAESAAASHPDLDPDPVAR